MLEWTYLYAAGRIQKPMLEVLPPIEETKSAMNANYNNALQASLVSVFADCERVIWVAVVLKLVLIQKNTQKKAQCCRFATRHRTRIVNVRLIFTLLN